MQLEEKFKPLIGCQTFININNGYLVIVSSGKALKLANVNNQATVGMLSGIRKFNRKKVLVVTYDGCNCFFYDPKFVTIV